MRSIFVNVLLFSTGFFLYTSCAMAQKQSDTEKEAIFIRQLYDEALLNGHAYEDLRSLCKDIGARLSGSAEAQMAVEWSKRKMEHYQFDKVYLQEVMVPHWDRGTKESGWYRDETGKLTKIDVLALGGSIGTNGILEGEIVLFSSREELLAAKESDVQGKIVFLNQPMDATLINTFNAYGGCYPIRGYGAIDAAKKGAIAVIIRSLSLSDHPHPHTGTMQYEEGVAKIPAAAISTRDAEQLAQRIKASSTPYRFVLEMNCRTLPDMLSYNVIGELTGTQFPNKIITFGGHLDSWDVGEGAHDDGAGVIHSLEALRLLKVFGYRPRHTLRVVFFMNEENGNMGGKTYAKKAKESGEDHIAAIESDRGGFAPRGFSCDGSADQLKLLQSLEPLFRPYELHKFEAGYGGVDIGPLKNEFDNIVLFGFIPDSQRYFDFHHNANDVFENVNKRELELGAASMATLIYLLDKRL
jgi:hypothetical protein